MTSFMGGSGLDILGGNTTVRECVVALTIISNSGPTNGCSATMIKHTT